MPTPDHKEAEQLAAKAELLFKRGEIAAAREIYLQAASAEQRAVQSFAGTGKTRTLNILAVSYASLLYKAKRLDLAERATCAYLGDPELNNWGRLKFRELLEVIWDEQVIEKQGLEYSGEEIWVALRGGEIGSGTAPADIALQDMRSANHFISRSIEWKAQFDFRPHGAAPLAVQQAIQARATQPTLGSYKFSVRLLKPDQLSLFPEGQPRQRVNPSEVAEFVVQFLQSLARGDQQMREVVPDARYRRAFLQLARNLVPSDSQMVREIEVLRLSGGHPQSALLVQQTRSAINTAIRGEGTQTAESTREEIRGVLRALHLDRNWLLIATPDGKPQRCSTREDVLDDVVGPMVNRPVVVTGQWRTAPGKPRRFHVDDIDLAP